MYPLIIKPVDMRFDYSLITNSGTFDQLLKCKIEILVCFTEYMENIRKHIIQANDGYL